MKKILGECEMMTDVEAMREDLKNNLRAKIGTVTFTKANGDERVMRCTLQESVLPAQTDIEEAVQKKTSTDSLAVWDLEKNAWRSFRYDTVISVTFEG
jgi:hypothetical protein